MIKNRKQYFKYKKIRRMIRKKIVDNPKILRGLLDENKLLTEQIEEYKKRNGK